MQVINYKFSLSLSLIVLNRNSVFKLGIIKLKDHLLVEWGTCFIKDKRSSRELSVKKVTLFKVITTQQQQQQNSNNNE